MKSYPVVLGGILAGGLSRRMGGVDKSLMQLGGTSLIERATTNLKPQVSHVAINANGNRDRFKTLETDIVADKIGGFAGPLAGIHALMDFAISQEKNYTHIVTTAADTPFFPTNLVEKLVGAASNSTIVIAKSGGYKHPVFGLWSIDLFAALTQFLLLAETRKVMAFVTEQVYSFAEFDFYQHQERSFDPFFNINCPDDLALATQYLSEWKSHAE